jgi:hypothetical protein
MILFNPRLGRIRVIILRIGGRNFGGEFLNQQTLDFSPRVGNQSNLLHPNTTQVNRNSVKR